MLAPSEAARPMSPRRTHPRRPPPHLSVSLRHDGPMPEEKADEAQVETQVEAKGRSSPGVPMRQPSDESYDSGESGKRWFDQANKHPGKGLGFPGMEDDEPPYFLPRNSSNHSIDASMDRTKLYPSHVTSQLQRLQRSVTSGSSVGDYRSVIDDLTIENQKLKQELRKFLKKPNDTPHLEKDKLFEIRIHGKLSARKRRELEDVLGSFASSIDEPTEKTSEQSKQSKATHSYSSLNHPKKSAAKNSSSSNTSTSRLPDSAYASMSNSGPTSLFTPTNYHSAEGRKATQPPVRSDQNIQSFLHNIPEGLLPKHNPVMTERQKKKFVVQRLEQLFTGRKGVVVGDHSQPLQQQEVSASAAKADQAANHGVSPLEGLREAHMLPHVMDVDKDKSKYATNHTANEFTEPYASDASDEASPNDSPGQRPTRPLDLDPDRAQVPSENVEYIRHLGLSTPKFTSETSSDSTTAADADGWIYLNLLVNMAQLHIVNVTPDFIREALSDVSERFQVSRDGKKVRWRGGTQGTRMSSDDGASSAENRSPDDSDSLDEPDRKRRKVDARKFAPIAVDTPDAEPTQNKLLQSFHYKPLFHHSESSGGFISSDESESLFGYNAKTAALPESTSADPQLWRGGPNQRSVKEKQDAGLLVYYNGARFCTDLSGDRGRVSTPLHNSAVDQDGYFSSHQEAIGGTSRKDVPMFERTPSGSLLPFRPFKDYSKGVSIPGIDDLRPTTPEPLTDGSNEDFFANVSAGGTTPPSQRQAFESSGLGGTRPADHFIMEVQTRRTMTGSRHSSKASRLSTYGSGQKKYSHSIPKSSLESFFVPGMRTSMTKTSSMAGTTGDSKESPSIKTEIISSNLTQLEPSELPPPLGYHTAYSSSDDDSDSSDASSQSSHRRRKPRYPQISLTSPIEHPSWAQRYPDGGLSDGDESDDPGEDDDGSIDMLAEARRIDPETIAAKEKEFEMGIDDKGTDAATVNESVSPGFRGARDLLRRSMTSEVPTSAITEDEY
ncbi:frequency clock protein [Cadophora sp. MPI-SDFR-AT-0126]|nr:frequency clock protein [Leotiomycetes sp. MPI-SDFR-AT-0126]